MSTHHRPDANRIALRAVRSILDAAHPFALSVEGRPVHVEVDRLPPSPWPSRLEGLEESLDGPFPSAVRVRCSWPDGSTELLVSAQWWKTTRAYRHLIGLRTAVAATNREFGWITVALPLRNRADGERVLIPAAFNSYAREAEPPEVLSRLKAAVHASGLPLISPWRVETFAIQLPSGAVEPSPAEAFRRLIHLALLKLPLLLQRGEPQVISGKPLFEIGDLPSPGGEDSETPVDEPVEGRERVRREGVGPMPGGVRQYKNTLDALLTRLREQPLSEEEFLTLLREQYEVRGATAKHSYITVLKALEVVDEREGRLELTPTGEEYLRDPRPEALFELLHRTYTGLLEILVVAEVLGSANTPSLRFVLPYLIGKHWKTDNQANFRRNWLLSLGATERDDDGDWLTELGRQLLATHAEETEPIRAQLAEIHDEGLVVGRNEDQEEEAPDVEEGTSGQADVSSVPTEPSGWDADHLDLSAARAASHSRGLELPRLLLEQACAALSSGKHLLLVGPPGTGKTELAHALVEAARAEGYCAGAFVSTASADWTTFDTIGGYALQRDGSLELRPGAFLRALERWQWLVIDEFNRADVDRAFGELMTVLAGRGTDTALVQADGRLVSIGSEPDRTHRVPRTFRVIATMNTWDKTSLFRLSHAVQRRFALLHVDIPEDDTYARLLETHATREGVEPPLPEGSLVPLRQLFSSSGLLAHRAVGPAVALDMVRYMRRRRASGDGLAEAMVMFLFPQLEGLEQEAASRVLEVLTASLAGWASPEAAERMRQRYQELFPHLAFKSA